VRNIVPLAVSCSLLVGGQRDPLFVDTLLSFAVISPASRRPSTRAEKRCGSHQGRIHRSRRAVRQRVHCHSIGMPVGIALATSNSRPLALHDESLRNGLIVQALLSVWSYMELRRALATYSRDQLKLKRRFGFVFMRWIAVLVACYVLLDIVGGDLAV
jgi:hypothetical protein